MSGAATLAEQLHSLSATLAAQIECGEYAALDADKRAELRMLPCFLAGLADRVGTVEAERDAVAALSAAQARGAAAGARFGWRLVQLAAIGSALTFLWRAA